MSSHEVDQSFPRAKSAEPREYHHPTERDENENLAILATNNLEVSRSGAGSHAMYISEESSEIFKELDDLQGESERGCYWVMSVTKQDGCKGRREQEHLRKETSRRSHELSLPPQAW